MATAASARPTCRRCAIISTAQLSLTNLGERDRTLVALLVDALDDDGYLTQSLEEIAALLPPEAEVELDELAIALRHLQNFDPSGVGARSPERVPGAADPRAAQPARPAPAAADAAVRSSPSTSSSITSSCSPSATYVRLKSATRASDDERCARRSSSSAA